MIVTEPQKHNSQLAIGEDDLNEASTYLEYLAVKSTWDDVERGIFVGATHAIKDHLVRELKDAGTGVGKGRFTAKDLLTESERVLLKASSGMSLLDRLKRDEKLREDMLSLLREFALDAELEGQDQLLPKSNPFKRK